jgi:hypothetical protein
MVELTMRPDMPGQTAVYEWLERYPEFAKMYSRAREWQAHTIADRATHMALHGAADPQSAAVQLNAIKWMAARLAPKVYGDKVVLNLGGQADNPVKVITYGWRKK